MKVFIFILSILFTHSVMAGLFDNEKRQYLKALKEFKKTVKLGSFEMTIKTQFIIAFILGMMTGLALIFFNIL